MLFPKTNNALESGVAVCGLYNGTPERAWALMFSGVGASGAGAGASGAGAGASGTKAIAGAGAGAGVSCVFISFQIDIRSVEVGS